METTDFEQIKNEFTKMDVDGKIDMYVSVEGLTGEQYKELLRNFPLEYINKLETALK